MSERRWAVSWYVLGLVFILLLAMPAIAEDSRTHTLFKAGRRALTGGDYIQAEGYLQAAFYAAKEEGASEETMALITGDLGLALLSQGRHSEAEQFLNRAAAVLQSSASANQQYLPIVLGNLARLYQELGQMQRSETVLRQALNLGRQTLKDRPLVLADLQGELGVLHFKVGRKNRAVRELKKALALVETNGGRGSLAQARILANLSTLYYTQQKWRLAEET